MTISNKQRERAIAAQVILENYSRIFGEKLIESKADVDASDMLDRAPYVVLSATGAFGTDHVFHYANQQALDLFDYKWEELIGKPSSASAEPDHRDERRKLLDEVGKKGFIENYSGIRISQTGRCFQIQDATVFNLLDSEGVYLGQAAVFSKWILL